MRARTKKQRAREHLQKITSRLRVIYHGGNSTKLHMRAAIEAQEQVIYLTKLMEEPE